MNKNDIVRLEITALTNEGNGVGRFEGVPVFVPYTAVGDVIDCRIVKTLKNFCYGKIENIIVKSPDRIEPDCKYFYKCGGCSFRHISYEAELLAKTKFVEDCFKRIGGFDLLPEPILASPEEKYYRNKTQLPVTEIDAMISYGFFSQRSHRVVAFDSCEIQPSEFCKISDYLVDFCNKNNVKAYDEEKDCGTLRHIYIRRGHHSSETMITLVLKHKTDIFNGMVLDIVEKFPNIKTIVLNINPQKTNVILGDEEIVIYGDGKISDTMCGNLIEISSKSFYQINTSAAEGVYRLAKEYADLKGNETLLDLYCGAGTVGLSMADSVKKLIGVEIIPEAIENAKRNAKRNGVINAEFICGDAGKIASMLVSRGEKPDVIVIDPPRKGADENTLNAIIEMAPTRVVYISCNPATAARDSKYLCENRYKLITYRPADMFPRTVHVECVVLLSKVQN